VALAETKYTVGFAKVGRHVTKASYNNLEWCKVASVTWSWSTFANPTVSKFDSMEIKNNLCVACLLVSFLTPTKPI